MYETNNKGVRRSEKKKRQALRVFRNFSVAFYFFSSFPFFFIFLRRERKSRSTFLSEKFLAELLFDVCQSPSYI